MTTIEPYALRDGTKRYEVRYRTPNRKTTRKRGFRTKRDAQQWAAVNTVRLNTGEWRPDSAGRITVLAAAKTWLETKSGTVAPKTYTGYGHGVRHLELVGTLGQTYLKDVTAEVVEQWIADLGGHVSPKTVRNSYGVLNQVMKRAVRDKRIASNPCVDVQLPRVGTHDIAVVSASDVMLMADAAGDYADVVKFLGMTGTRWGEMAGLQVQDVDLENLRLHIRRQITEDGATLVHGLPKYNKRRLVPIMAPLVEILKTRMSGKSSDDLVFTTSRGTVLRNRNARRDWFDAAAVSAGHPGLTPHELRHTFASVAIASGANVKALQQALGHATAAFTLDRYGHLYPDDLGGFVTGMASRFTGECVQNVSTEGKK